MKLLECPTCELENRERALIGQEMLLCGRQAYWNRITHNCTMLRLSSCCADFYTLLREKDHMQERLDSSRASRYEKKHAKSRLREINQKLEYYKQRT